MYDKSARALRGPLHFSSMIRAGGPA